MASSVLISERDGHESTVMKVLAASAPRGPNNERYLALGKEVGMRLFFLEAGRGDAEHARNYDMVGYCIEGKARLSIHGRGQDAEITPGVAYSIPKGTPHQWHIEERFVGVEGTHPIPFLHDRDRPAHGPGAAAGAADVHGSAIESHPNVAGLSAAIGFSGLGSGGQV